jgi:hypothetical protein
MMRKIVLWIAAAVAFLFAGATGYLAYFSGGQAGSDGTVRVLAKDQDTTVSGREGKLVLAYAGDLSGNLEPCG